MSLGKTFFPLLNISTNSIQKTFPHGKKGYIMGKGLTELNNLYDNIHKFKLAI